MVPTFRELRTQGRIPVLFRKVHTKKQNSKYDTYFKEKIQRDLGAFLVLEIMKLFLKKGHLN